MYVNEPLRLSETINESGLEVDSEHLQPTRIRSSRLNANVGPLETARGTVDGETITGGEGGECNTQFLNDN